MSVTVVCPNCQASYQVPDDQLGVKVGCPQCQAIFVAGGPRAIGTVLPVETAHTPQVTVRKRKRKSILRQLGPVGILLVSGGIFGTLILVAGSLIFFVIRWQEFVTQQEQAARDMAQFRFRGGMMGMAPAGDPIEDDKEEARKPPQREPVTLPPPPKPSDLASLPALEARDVELLFRPQVGSMDVLLHSWLDLELQKPDGKQHVTATTATDLVETTQAINSAEQAIMRVRYRGHSLNWQGGDKSLPADPIWQTFQQGSGELVAQWLFDPSGHPLRHQLDLGKAAPNTRGDLAEAHERMRLLYEVLSVPLPNRRVKPHSTWQAPRNLRIAFNGRWAETVTVPMTYTYMGARKNEGREEAGVSLKGQFRGEKVTGQAEGLAVIDLETGQTIWSALVVRLDMTFKDETLGRATGTWTLRMQRTPPPPPDAN